MTTPLEDARDLLARYDGLEVPRRIDAAGQGLLSEVRTRAVVSIAESLDTIARNGFAPTKPPIWPEGGV